MSASTSRYDQLIQDLRSELRPQRAWGEGRGNFAPFPAKTAEPKLV